MKLNQLSDNKGACVERLRVGRGIGSGKGKTSGRGVKGQTSRSGVSINGFEGGQMPIYRRLPKRGFVNIFRKHYAIVTLARLQKEIDSGRLNPSLPITYKVLSEAGVVRSSCDGLRVLGGGELKVPLNFEVAGASKSVVAAVEKLGGRIVIAS